MKQWICSLSLRCAMRALQLRFNTVDLTGFEITQIRDLADGGMIIVLDKRS